MTSPKLKTVLLMRKLITNSEYLVLILLAAYQILDAVFLVLNFTIVG